MDHNFWPFYLYIEGGVKRYFHMIYWKSPTYLIHPSDRIVDLRISAMLSASGCLDAPLE
jgi:hypothetical protein